MVQVCHGSPCERPAETDQVPFWAFIISVVIFIPSAGRHEGRFADRFPKSEPPIRL